MTNTCSASTAEEQARRRIDGQMLTGDRRSAAERHLDERRRGLAVNGYDGRADTPPAKSGDTRWPSGGGWTAEVIADPWGTA